MLMQIKKFLRQFGYDVRRYHSLYETVLKHHRIETIIDIGANDGMWSKEMRAIFPGANIYAFEPLRDCFERLTKRFSDDKQFQAYNLALGDSEGTREIERSSFHPSSSLLHMSNLHKELYPKSKNLTKEQITIRRLDSLQNELKLTPDLLIKMDVQGFEDKVIGGGKEIFQKAKIVIVETAFVLLYENQPLFGDIHQQLQSLGFTYRGNCGEHYSSKTGERIYEDSVFVRSDNL